MSDHDGALESRLAELGETLPPSRPAAGLYAPAVISGNILYISGSGDREGLSLGRKGKLGRDLGLEEGRASARGAALEALRIAKDSLGGLDRIRRILRLTGYIDADPEFERHPEVLDGASSLFLDLFGTERGGHARSAIGVSSLPFGLPVEIDLVLEIEP